MEKIDRLMPCNLTPLLRLSATINPYGGKLCPFCPTAHFMTQILCEYE